MFDDVEGRKGNKKQTTNHCMVCNLEAARIDLSPLHGINGGLNLGLNVRENEMSLLDV